MDNLFILSSCKWTLSILHPEPLTLSPPLPPFPLSPTQSFCPHLARHHIQLGPIDPSRSIHPSHHFLIDSPTHHHQSLPLPHRRSLTSPTPSDRSGSCSPPPLIRTPSPFQHIPVGAHFHLPLSPGISHRNCRSIPSRSKAPDPTS